MSDKSGVYGLMGTCNFCGKSTGTISKAIGFCGDCITAHFDRLWPDLRRAHQHTRRIYGLPEAPPQAIEGLTCPFCVRQCRIPEGDTGYCGIRSAKGHRIRGGRPHEGNLSYYFDPLPTNCVGDFVCAAGTQNGYPQYSVSKGPEYGYNNLAVFYRACSFNCLYCQNYHFKDKTFSSSRIPAKQLANVVDERTTCICYFGGDPTPQILHALKTSTVALKKTTGRILRICWETNGAMTEPFLTKVADLSLTSGGCIKLDLKAWDEGIHYALCGVSNKKTLENFAKLAMISRKRPEPPFLIASTLLVPGYIGVREVTNIARFISGLNPEIPYSLLAFYPHFYLKDLPVTSRSQALRYRAAAKTEGVRNVHLGNVYLLGEN